MISFTVPGNPVGYLRMTQGQVRLMKIPDRDIRSAATLKVKERIQRYLEYKRRVNLLAVKFQFDRKPKRKIYLDVTIWLASRCHFDPDNVRKVIQDGLFDQDRLVAGAVDFGYDATNPRVEVRIFEP